MIKHYVEFLFNGNEASYFLDYSSVEEKMADRDFTKVEIPDGAFAFQFFDRAEHIEDGEIFYGEDKNYSTMYFIGKFYTLDEILDSIPKGMSKSFSGVHNVLINGGLYPFELRRHIWDNGSNIDEVREKGWKGVVYTACGRWEPVIEEDVVIER